MLVSDLGRAGLIYVAALSGLAFAQSGGCLIDSQSVGPIRLGMTVSQVRQTLRSTTLRPSQDGDGLSLLQVMRDRLHTMDLYVDAKEGVRDRSKIDLIRVYDGACATRDGVHPGMPLAEATRRYGRIHRLMWSGIESRAYPPS